MKTIFLLMALSLSLSCAGCIGDYGQYRGAANGVELRTQPDGTRIVNVSGDAEATVNQDGSVVAKSKSNVDKALELLKALP